MLTDWPASVEVDKVVDVVGAGILLLLPHPSITRIPKLITNAIKNVTLLFIENSFEFF
jgi:hypothetical protein